MRFKVTCSKTSAKIRRHQKGLPAVGVEGEQWTGTSGGEGGNLLERPGPNVACGAIEEEEEEEEEEEK